MSWTAETNIKGPKGDKGDQGDPGTSGTGTGNVVGPASAVADRIATYNGASGTVIKDGGKLISDLAPVANPVFTGDPQAPTPVTADNDTSIATTAFVKAAIAAGGGGGAASGITVTPAGNIAATNVQAALIELDTEKVAKAGDTMTGNLIINKSNPSYVLQKTTSGQANQIAGYNDINPRWSITLGDSSAESGSNAGSNFGLYRFTDAGAQVDAPLTVARASGVVNFTQTPTVAGVPISSGAATVAPIIDGTATVGIATKYAREDHIHPSDVNARAVRFDAAQALTTLQQTQARQNIYAAPLDALAYSGMQINGSMDVSQEFGTASVAVNNTNKYVMDGWGVAVIGAGTTSSCTQAAITSLPGFPNCLQFAVTAANSLAGANDGSWIYHFIEGYRWARLGWGYANPQSVTISFWVWPNISGTMAVSVRGSGPRSYVVDVPVTAGGWQYKTVTIPGDAAGTWPTSTAAGATISFDFGAGSSKKAASATWVGTDALATAATTNFFATTGTIYLTGVTVLPGTDAPSAARSSLIMRPYDQELPICRRYLWRRTFPPSQNIGAMQCYSATLAGGPLFRLQPNMRIAPTVTISAPGNYVAYNASGSSNLTGVTLNFGSSVEEVWLNTSTFTTGLTAGNASLFVSNIAGGWMQMDARL